jgi:hypothetical protein
MQLYKASQKPETGARPGPSPRALGKATEQSVARAPSRGVSVNAVALLIGAFFVFVVLASCIAANDRAGDSFVPRELN